MRRAALVLAVVAAMVVALRMVPPAPARAAGLCSFPVIGTVCAIVSGVTDGVSWTVSSSTGLVRDAAGKVIAKVANKLGTLACVTTSEATTDGIATPLAAGFCGAVVGKLTSLLGKRGRRGRGAQRVGPRCRQRRQPRRLPRRIRRIRRRII